jgi:DNA-binding NtrC family response regulator
LRRHPGEPARERALRAPQGTLFLDEVGELPAALQVKLLRFLQSGEVRPVGAESAVQVPVRIVAATNRDLRAEVDAGAFREDFFYRLSAYEIVLPPLRERRSDIPLLVEHFRRRHQERLGLDLQPASDKVIAALAAHPWPGNVRELEHVVQRAIVDSGSLADPESVRPLLTASGGEQVPARSQPAIGDELSLEELEKLHIEAVLRRCGGNRTRAAEILGIERKSLYRKAKRLGIALDGEEVES